MKRQVKRMLSRYGYKLVKIEKDKISEADPRLLPYLNDLPYRVINLPIERGVGWRHYPLGGKTYHPFICALRHYQTDASNSKRIKEVLYAYAQNVHYASPNEALGPISSKPFFENAHPQEFTLPWFKNSPEEQKRDQLNSIRRENKLYGYDSESTLTSKPLSKRKIEIEAQRLLSLFKSVKEKGYHTDYHDALNGYVLIDGDEWKWLVNSGQHRVAVLSVLGYKKIPVHVKQIIRREDVKIWPAVKKKIYNEETALEVFDNLFNAKLPTAAQKWKQYVDENLSVNT